MLLTRIEASGFRNLEGAVEFGPGLNIFYGDNAQGKTNWLEAIYLLANTKSFRTGQVRECITFDSPPSILRGDVSRGSVKKQLQLLLTESSKELFVNGKREALVRYITNLDVFVFSLEEMEVIRGEPAQRRRFIDRGVVTIKPGFLSTLAEYNRVVRQKNRLLAEASESSDPGSYYSQIDAWNDQLVDLGATIHDARLEYVGLLNRVLEENDHGRAIFGAERITARYQSQLEGKGDLGRYRELFRERLTLRMAAETAAGHCLIGPHRDDLRLMLNGKSAAQFGSEGQKRTLAIALKMAQAEYLTGTHGAPPILLIDDIMGELDLKRRIKESQTMRRNCIWNITRA